MTQRPAIPIGKYAGIVYRQEIMAKLSEQQEQAGHAHSPSDKMMADARKRVLSRLKAIDARQAKHQKIASNDIGAVLKRYLHNSMEEGYTNVYGGKAVCLL